MCSGATFLQGSERFPTEYSVLGIQSQLEQLINILDWDLYMNITPCGQPRNGNFVRMLGQCAPALLSCKDPNGLRHRSVG
jgi:hypothetical protein